MLALSLVALLPAFVSAFNYGGKTGAVQMKFGDTFKIQEHGGEGRYVQVTNQNDPKSAFMLGSSATQFVACAYDGNDCSQHVGEVVGDTVILAYQNGVSSYYPYYDGLTSPVPCDGKRIWSIDSKDNAKSSLMTFVDNPEFAGYIWSSLPSGVGAVDVKVCSENDTPYLVFGGSSSSAKDFDLIKV